MSRLALALAALLPLAACDEPEVMCTDIAMVSVTVNVTDADGAPVADADVAYAEAGAAPVACETYADGVYTCGYEVAGELTITVALGGEVVAEEVVVVEADACHVIGETLDIVVPPAA